MKTKNSRCLVLNADYSPLCIVSWTRAMSWSLGYTEDDKHGVDILDFYKDDFIQGAHDRKYPIPAVVRTRKFFKTSRHGIAFNRRNVFIRDDYTCLYCHKIFDSSELTYDHVIPKSLWNYKKGTPTVWTNIATSCVKCNHKKGNRTPQQAQMPLLHLPYVPAKSSKFLPINRYLTKIKDSIPEEWAIYLPESYKQNANV
jgi:5-methylcytosine-specific restriction endonuclease McrA